MSKRELVELKCDICGHIQIRDKALIGGSFSKDWTTISYKDQWQSHQKHVCSLNCFDKWAEQQRKVKDEREKSTND